MISAILNLSTQGAPAPKKILALDVVVESTFLLFESLNNLNGDYGANLDYDAIDLNLNVDIAFTNAMNNLHNYTVVIIGSSLKISNYQLLESYKETFTNWVKCGGTLILLGNNSERLSQYTYNFLPSPIMVSTLARSNFFSFTEDGKSLETTPISYPWEATAQTYLNSQFDYTPIAYLRRSPSNPLDPHPVIDAIIKSDFHLGHIIVTFMALDSSYIRDTSEGKYNYGVLMLNLLNYGLESSIGDPLKTLYGRIILTTPLQLPPTGSKIISYKGTRTVTFNPIISADTKITFYGLLSIKATYKLYNEDTEKITEYTLLNSIPFLVYLERYSAGCCCTMYEPSISGVVEDIFVQKSKSNPTIFFEADTIAIKAQFSMLPTEI